MLLKYLILKRFLCGAGVLVSANSTCKEVALTYEKSHSSHLLCTSVNVIQWPLVPARYLAVARAPVPEPQLSHSFFSILQQISCASFFGLQWVLGHLSGSAGWMSHHHNPSCSSELCRGFGLEKDNLPSALTHLWFCRGVAGSVLQPSDWDTTAAAPSLSFPFPSPGLRKSILHRSSSCLT